MSGSGSRPIGTKNSPCFLPRALKSPHIRIILPRSGEAVLTSFAAEDGLRTRIICSVGLSLYRPNRLRRKLKAIFPFDVTGLALMDPGGTIAGLRVLNAADKAAWAP